MGLCWSSNPHQFRIARNSNTILPWQSRTISITLKEYDNTQTESSTVRRKDTCGTDCPLFYHCRHVGDPDSLAVKIAQLCSDKFREGYRKGYNQRKREEKK